MEVNYELHHGDCLDWMPKLASKGVKVGMVLADTPFGTTQCVWDSVIPLAPMWAALKSVIFRKATTVMFGSQPFTSLLITSNMEWFRRSLVWDKVSPVGVANCKKMELRQHEDIVIFSEYPTVYNAQLINKTTVKKRFGAAKGSSKSVYQSIGDKKSDGVGYATSILRFMRPNNLTGGGLHPNQKPVALLEYLIKTYTNPGDTVLDFCMGSGSTGEACANTGRNFIGIELYPLLDRPIDKEKNPDNFGIAQSRIEKAYRRANGLPVKGKATDTLDLPLFA